MSRTSSRTGIPLFCAVALIAGPGCTTTRTIDPQSQSPTTSELEVGDTVKVTLTDGSELDMTFVTATAEHVVGRDRGGTEHRISRQDISYLQVSSISTGRTLLLVGGVVLVIGLGQLAAAYACFLGGPC